jgi:hypothetical protein
MRDKISDGGDAPRDEVKVISGEATVAAMLDKV